MKNKIFTVLMICLTSVALVACSSKGPTKSTEQSKTSKQQTSSSSVNLDQVASQAQKQADVLKTNAGGTYSSITVTPKGKKSLIYHLTLAQKSESVDEESLKTVLVSGLKSSIQTALKQDSHLKIQLLLSNPDQSEVLNTVVSQVDLKATIQ